MKEQLYGAEDQFGKVYLCLKKPRRDLLALLGRKSAKSMFCETLKGEIKHIGYVIGHQWLRVFKMDLNWKEEKIAAKGDK